MSLTTAQLKAALATAQTTYAQALNAFLGALVDVESLTQAVESCGGGQQIHVSQMARDRLHEFRWSCSIRFPLRLQARRHL